MMMMMIITNRALGLTHSLNMDISCQLELARQRF